MIYSVVFQFLFFHCYSVFNFLILVWLSKTKNPANFFKIYPIHFPSNQNKTLSIFKRCKEAHITYIWPFYLRSIFLIYIKAPYSHALCLWRRQEVCRVKKKDIKYWCLLSLLRKPTSVQSSRPPLEGGGKHLFPCLRRRHKGGGGGKHVKGFTLDAKKVQDLLPIIAALQGRKAADEGAAKQGLLRRVIKKNQKVCIPHKGNQSPIDLCMWFLKREV